MATLWPSMRAASHNLIVPSKEHVTKSGESGERGIRPVMLPECSCRCAICRPRGVQPGGGNGERQRADSANVKALEKKQKEVINQPLELKKSFIYFFLYIFK